MLPSHRCARPERLAVPKSQKLTALLTAHPNEQRRADKTPLNRNPNITLYFAWSRSKHMTPAITNLCSRDRPHPGPLLPDPRYEPPRQPPLGLRHQRHGRRNLAVRSRPTEHVLQRAQHTVPKRRYARPAVAVWDGSAHTANAGTDPRRSPRCYRTGGGLL